MTHRIGRRRFLQGLSGAAGAALLGPSVARDAPPRLPIPPLLDARAQGGRIELVAQPGETQFRPGVASPTAGYNGSYLGPTLRVHSGDDVQVQVTNRLQEETNVHWHGLLVPSQVDGPHHTIAPGGRWAPVLPVRQPAATAWYHAHPHMRTARQVYAGLAGLVIVTDAQEQSLQLPARYGIDDLPLVLQDKALDSGGRLVYPTGHMHAMHGVHGNVMLVNGAPQPVAAVPAGRVRLRLLNAANARLLDIAFEDGRSFHWIATEGGLLRRPVELRRLSLAAGQRAEVLVDFTDANAVGMVSLPPRGRPLPVMRFEPQGSPAAAPALPAQLAAWTSKAAADATRRRRLVLQSGGMMMGGGMGAMHAGMGLHTIDGKPFDMRRIDQRVRLGDTEIWEVTADGMVMPHPFHIHGVQFEVLSRGGQAPVVEDQGRRDTVIVDEAVELLVHFTQPAGEQAPFMYHCHILEHEDMGMMGQFTVA